MTSVRRWTAALRAASQKSSRKIRFTARPLAAASRFRREEDGSLLVFGLMMFVLMLMVAGISVDLMHYETRRAQVQSTLDTAVLAAANLDQTIDPTTVVKDYFAKAGLSEYLGAVTSDRTIGYSKVSADADVKTGTNFMRMMGIDTLQSVAASTAQESIGNVEISLVLDNSGSMADDSKIQNLRTAAKQFIDTMFSTVDEGKLSMSVISYSAGVNIGPTMMSELNTSSEQSVASCIDFSNADFTTTALNSATKLQRSAWFDPWDTGSSMNPLYHPCPLDTTASRRSVFFSAKQSSLDSFVGSMIASDNTSIDLGVKWGAAALDPSMQPIVTDLIAKGIVSTDAAGRPADYSDKQTLKVIVVMTDGENTQRQAILAPYNSGNSSVWLWQNGSSTGYSLYDATKNQYYSTTKGAWYPKPYGQNSTTTCTTTTSGKGRNQTTTTTCNTTNDPGTATQQTWQQVWARLPVEYFLSSIIKPAYGSSAVSNWRNKIETTTDSAQMDTNLHNICSAAKANNVTIYSIGFETSSAGKAVLTDCATSPAYYFGVSGLEISSAFASIATNINRLRLVQ